MFMNGRNLFDSLFFSFVRRLWDIRVDIILFFLFLLNFLLRNSLCFFYLRLGFLLFLLILWVMFLRSDRFFLFSWLCYLFNFIFYLSFRLLLIVLNLLLSFLNFWLLFRFFLFMVFLLMSWFNMMLRLFYLSHLNRSLLNGFFFILLVSLYLFNWLLMLNLLLLDWLRNFFLMSLLLFCWFSLFLIIFFFFFRFRNLLNCYLVFNMFSVLSLHWLGNFYLMGWFMIFLLKRFWRFLLFCWFNMSFLMCLKFLRFSFRLFMNLLLSRLFRSLLNFLLRFWLFFSLLNCLLFDFWGFFLFYLGNCWLLFGFLFFFIFTFSFFLLFIFLLFAFSFLFRVIFLRVSFGAFPNITLLFLFFFLCKHFRRNALFQSRINVTLFVIYIESNFTFIISRLFQNSVVRLIVLLLFVRFIFFWESIAHRLIRFISSILRLFVMGFSFFWVFSSIFCGARLIGILFVFVIFWFLGDWVNVVWISSGHDWISISFVVTVLIVNDWSFSLVTWHVDNVYNSDARIKTIIINLTNSVCSSVILKLDSHHLCFLVIIVQFSNCQWSFCTHL